MVAPPIVPALAEPYAACLRIARDHYENFPVASRLLPAPMRPHVAALYAFARIADDFADEGQRAASERLALLDAWLDRLRACPAARGSAASDEAMRLQGTVPLPAPTEAVFAALDHTIQVCDLPISLLEDLISAFRQDVTTCRYRTWDEVLDYCRRSANPVGRLVLRIAGRREEALDLASDALCTALQLTNFWQDLERDWRQGRLYLPLDDCRRERAEFEDLDQGRLTAAWRRVIEGAADRTAALYDRGRLVCDAVDGRLRIELRFTWLGGRRILSRLERAGFDVFRERPALGARDLPALIWQAFTWRTS